MNEVILIVTPDPNQKTMLRSNLENDFTVYTATSGDEVLDLSFRHHPKVILIDMRLPSGSGLDVLSQLREYPRTAHIPLMFMVDGTDTLMKPNFLEAGAYDVLEKPLDLAELGLRIRNVLGRSSQEGYEVHPITHLPTGQLIEKIQTKARRPYAQINLRIQGFDTFKDLNGFVTANEALIFTGTVLSEMINLIGSPEDFVGHAEEAMFIIITSPARAGACVDYLAERLGEQLPQFHSFIERDQGYIELEDGTYKPLMSLEMETSISS